MNEVKIPLIRSFKTQAYKRVCKTNSGHFINDCCSVSVASILKKSVFKKMTNGEPINFDRLSARMTSLVKISWQKGEQKLNFYEDFIETHKQRFMMR